MIFFQLSFSKQDVIITNTWMIAWCINNLILVPRHREYIPNLPFPFCPAWIISLLSCKNVNEEMKQTVLLLAIHLSRIWYCFDKSAYITVAFTNRGRNVHEINKKAQEDKTWCMLASRYNKKICGRVCLGTQHCRLQRNRTKGNRNMQTELCLK